MGVAVRENMGAMQGDDLPHVAAGVAGQAGVAGRIEIAGPDRVPLGEGRRPSAFRTVT